MTPGGRFGQLLAAAVNKKGISLRQLAESTSITYEQCRKLWIGTSSPSPLRVKDLSKRLNMDLKAAEEAVAADKIERRYGKAGLKVRGQDPRLSALNAVAMMLTDDDIAALTAMAQSLVAVRHRA